MIASMTSSFTPPFVAPAAIDQSLRRDGHAPISAGALCQLTSTTVHELNALAPAWNRLPPDAYLRDGGRYRRRRHSCFTVDANRLELVPHRAHWQPVEYNALHGGLERWFEPIETAVSRAPAWQRLLISLGDIASRLRGRQPWYVEAHQFRIDTTDGIGRPTPEGAHRDGVDLVIVLLVTRHAVKGGETRVFDATGPRGQRFTLSEPWTALLIDDARVIHETTPIQPISDGGWRDTLVLTYRSGSFQGPVTT